MSARIVCLASAKGGAGKTLLTATFGHLLADLGFRVLMVDTDAATNGLSLLYLKNIIDAPRDQGRPRGVFELDEPDTKPTVTTLGDNLDLLPATYEFRNTESMPVDRYSASLEAFIRGIRDRYDFVFLDAQAGSDEYAQVSISARLSDQVVIVSEYDPMSAAGVERLKALFGDDLGYFRTWVLLNKMLPDFVKSFSEFLEIARYASPIPWDADVVRAYARRGLALDTERGNEHTLAVIQTMRSLFGATVEERIDAWLSSRAEKIREPIRKQIVDLRKELIALGETAHMRNRRTMIQARIVRATAIATTALGVVAGVLINAGTTVAAIGAGSVLVLIAAVTVLIEMRPAPTDDPGQAVADARRVELMQKIDRLVDLERLGPEAILKHRRSLEVS